MARLARYGNVQPDVFEAMLEDDAIELVNAVERLRADDEKRRQL
jgi:hypothetical protein